MSVPEKKLVTLSQLQMQAERIKSELDKYALESEMQQAVEDAVAQANICTIEVVDAVPEAETASENVLYLYHNTGTGNTKSTPLWIRPLSAWMMTAEAFPMT